MKEGPNFARLIDYWKIQGLAIAEGAGESELDEFESREGVRIPNEFRTYLLAVNGMVQDYDSDGNLFAFWSLPRIKSVREECPECFVDETTGNFYAFADFIMWSWAYAVEMSSDPCSAGKVILVGGLRPQMVSQSFAEFIELYIQDARAIYSQS